jgi:isochorismate pyruvate lyase
VSHTVAAQRVRGHILGMSDDLAKCRAEIDAIDARIMDLLMERFAVVDRVISHKAAHGLPADIPARVGEVLQHARQLAMQRGLPPSLAEGLWQQLIAETIAYERRKKIA